MNALLSCVVVLSLFLESWKSRDDEMVVEALAKSRD